MENNLERLIKQNIPFTSQGMKAQIGVLFLAYRYTSSRQSFFKNYNITLQQYNILRILRGQFPRPANISMLRERMLDKMSDTSRIIEKLRLKELVERTTSSSDRRSCEVLVTSKGLKVLEKIDAASETLDGLFSSMHETEMKSLNNLLDNLRG